MASVNWKKVKSGTEVSALIKHNDRENRIITNHSNEHIDKSKTKLNGQYKVNGLNGTYDNTFKKYKSRISYLDETTNKNKRKDRVTCISLEIPVPDGIESYENQKDFLLKCTNILRERYGNDNFINCYHHFDEIHDYIDCNTKKPRTSRPHLHFMFVPEIDGKLNAKKIENRKEMREVNKLIEEMSVKEFGVSFLTGEGTKDKRTVEELKRLSEILEREKNEEKRYNELHELVKNEEKQLNSLKGEKFLLETHVSSVKNEMFKLERDVNEKKGDITALNDEITVLRNKKKNISSELQKLRKKACDGLQDEMTTAKNNYNNYLVKRRDMIFKDIEMFRSTDKFIAYFENSYPDFYNTVLKNYKESFKRNFDNLTKMNEGKVNNKLESVLSEHVNQQDDREDYQPDI